MLLKSSIESSEKTFVKCLLKAFEIDFQKKHKNFRDLLDFVLIKNAFLNINRKGT